MDGSSTVVSKGSKGGIYNFEFILKATRIKTRKLASIKPVK
jgi:hypothetical protein